MKPENWKRLHSTWKDMIRRCNNQEIKCWKWYGGRGIKVCDRWLVSERIPKNGSRRCSQGFQNFYEDMGSTWFEGATIDRIDNDGDYTPENCRWLTRSENARRSNIGITKPGTSAAMIGKVPWNCGLDGSDNPLYGRICITNGIDVKMISAEETLPNGWWNGGRKLTIDQVQQRSFAARGNQNNRGKVWITNGKERTLISSTKPIPDEWKRGFRI